jgi:sporulation and spore germination protein/immunoglobulin-like protein involved in spore germination
MRRRARVLIPVLVAVVLAGCGGSTQQGSPTTSTTRTTSTTPTRSTSTTTPPAETIDVRAYFLMGEKVAAAHRQVAVTQAVATAAMRELLAGPSAGDRDAGMATAVPAGTRLLGISIAGGTATVDLSGAFESGGGSLSMTARLAQVTFTLTQFPTVGQVVFELDGKPVTVFGGEGIMLDHPATRSSFESLAPAILVEQPGRGWTVESPFHVSGSADVYEAQFELELTDGAGHVLTRQPVHASSGTGTRGTFDTTVSFPTGSAGAATLTVFDLSPKDGTRIDVVTVPLRLR